MKITVKMLQGGEYAFEVDPTTRISDLKQQISEKLTIPVERQKLLLLGRTLTDEQTVQSYPSIKDGTKLNLVVKKAEGFYEAYYKYFKDEGMTDIQAKNSASRLMKVVQEKFDRLSWDDIERLSEDCMRFEEEQRKAANQGQAKQ